MSKNETQPPPPHGGWWFVWLLAIFVLPPISAWLAFNGGVFLRTIGLIFGVAAIVLHLLSCAYIAPEDGCLGLFLLLGGYALLLAAVLIGCAVSVPY